MPTVSKIAVPVTGEKCRAHHIRNWAGWFGILCVCLAGCGALQSSRKIAPTEPPPPEVQELVSQAHALLTQDRFREASKLYLEALSHYPDFYEAHQALVGCEDARGGLNQLENYYRDRIAREPAAAGWHFGLALASWLNRKPSQAVRAFVKADQLDPHAAEITLLRGIIFLYQGQAFNAAREQFRRATELEPEFASGYFNLAVLALEVDRDKEEAEASGLKALSCFKPHQKVEKLKAHMFLGRLYEDEGRLDDALEQYQQAKVIDIGLTYAQVDLGKLLLEMGKPDQAKQERQAALEELGWGSPGGLRVIRNTKAEAGRLLDYTHLLPGDDVKQYASLLSYLGRPRPVGSVRVPARFSPHLSPLNTVVTLLEADLDADGIDETVVLEATQSRYIGTLDFVLSQPVLHIFSADTNHLLACKLGHEHFWGLGLLDLNADGGKELIATGIKGPNELCLNVIARVGEGFGTVLALGTSCWSERAGFLVCDLEDDRTYEIVVIGGMDHWIDVYGWEGDGFEKKNTSFPEFYTWYVKQMEHERNAWRGKTEPVAAHLKEARQILAGAPSALPEQAGPGPQETP